MGDDAERYVRIPSWCPDVLCLATCACPYEYPASKGVVRGEVFVGGYVIEKIDENTTQITYVSDADLKGSIPGLIKNTLSAKQGEIASKIGPSMEKDGFK